MKLSSVSCKNFLSFGSRRSTLEFRHIDVPEHTNGKSRFAFVVGENGSGKTNWVRSIVFVLDHIPNDVHDEQLPVSMWNVESEGTVSCSLEFILSDTERELLISLFLLSRTSLPSFMDTADDSHPRSTFIEQLQQYWKAFSAQKKKLIKSTSLFRSVRFSYDSLPVMSAHTVFLRVRTQHRNNWIFINRRLEDSQFSKSKHYTGRIREENRDVALQHELLGDLQEFSGRQSKSLMIDEYLDSLRDVVGQKDVDIDVLQRGIRDLHNALRRLGQKVSQDEAMSFVPDLWYIMSTMARESTTLLPQDRGLLGRRSRSSLPYEITLERAKSILLRAQFSESREQRELFRSVNKDMNDLLGCKLECVVGGKGRDDDTTSVELMFSETNSLGRNMTTEDVFGAAYELLAVLVALFLTKTETVILDDPARGGFAGLRTGIRDMVLTQLNRSVLVVTQEFDLLPVAEKPYSACWRMSKSFGGDTTSIVDLQNVVDSHRLARFCLSPARRHVLFSSSVIFVEGQHDMRFFRALDFILRSSRQPHGWKDCRGLACDIFEMGGKGGAYSALKVIKEFKIAGVVVMDWDSLVEKREPHKDVSDNDVDKEAIADICCRTGTALKSISSSPSIVEQEIFMESIRALEKELNTLNLKLSGKAEEEGKHSPSTDYEGAAWTDIPNHVAFRVAVDAVGIPKRELMQYKQFEPYSHNAVDVLRSTLSRWGLFIWGPECVDIEGVLNFDKRKGGAFQKAKWADQGFEEDIALVSAAMKSQSTIDSPMMQVKKFLLDHRCLLPVSVPYTTSLERLPEYFSPTTSGHPNL